MKGLTRFIFIFALVALAGASAEEASSKSKGSPIEITAEGDNHYAAGIATANGNVVVRYQQDILYADKIIYDAKAREVAAEGNVRIYSGNKVFRGEKIRYNFETQSAFSTDFQSSSYPLLARGASVETPVDKTYVMKDGAFTTDNRLHPSYQFKAKTVVIYPDEEVVLKNVTVCIGDVPVLWIPIFAQAMKDDRSNYEFQLGSRSKQGYYFLNTYNWWSSPSLRGSVNLDLRSKRGIAGGIDLDFKWTKESTNLLQTYFAQDNRPNYNDSSIPRTGSPKTRYLLGLKENVPMEEGLLLQTDFTKMSDQYIKEDFFESEFRNNRQPDQMIAVTQTSPNFSLTLLTRKQINNFFETVERLPELRLESKRSKLMGTGIAYEGETSLTNFVRKYAPDNPYNTYFQAPTSATNPGDYTAYRYDTFHQFLYPQQYFNWLSLTPRAGLRATYYNYNDSAKNRANFLGYNTPGSQLEDFGRVALNVGAEASFKVSRVWSDVQSKAWGIDGLRHVMEPYANFQYTYVGDGKPSQFAGFDERVASTRLAPINYTAYNSIDSIDTQSVINPGIRNKIQTKRDGLNYDLLDWAVYTDVDLERKFNTVHRHLMSNVYSEFDLKPVPWLSFNSFSGIDLSGDGYDVSDNSIKWQATRALEVGLGNRYLRNFPSYPNSDLLYLSLFYRLNEHWQFASKQSFESDDNTVEEHEYTVYRDLSAWQMAVSYREANNRQSKSEQQFYITLTLKAFPNQKIGF